MRFFTLAGTIALSFSLLTCGPSFAEITFQGEGKVPAFTIAKVRAKSDDFKSFIYKVYGPDGKRVRTERGEGGWLLFTGPAGKYRVEAVAGRTDKDGNLTLEEAEYDIVIEGAGPPPKPDPDPGPGPKPQPDGPMGLRKASRDGMAKVSSANRAAEAKSLATTQRNHASQVAAGVFHDAVAILEGWRQANRGELSAEQQKLWKPWADAVKARIEALHKGGSLPSHVEWAEAFNEIADGLDPQTALKGRK